MHKFNLLITLILEDGDCNWQGLNSWPLGSRAVKALVPCQEPTLF